MGADSGLEIQRRIVEALRDPARYPHAVDAVSVIETHISFVLLTGSYAYKIKKSVALGFVDYTSLEKRRHFCDEELRLNRRLAPLIYLDVCVISGSPDQPCFLRGGEAIEYAVKMVQFDSQNLFDQALGLDRLTPAHIDTLAHALAAFHQAAAPARPVSGYGNPDEVWAALVACVRRLQAQNSVSPRQIASLKAWCQPEYVRLREGFARRKAQGFVRECHGDLHLGNLVLWDGEPLVFDGIEFNEALRWIDVISDLAFLIMDFSVHDRPEFAWRLLNTWLEDSGDHTGLDLLRFYMVYRALVRAEVAGLRAADASHGPARRRADLASSAIYMDYALTLIVPEANALIITHGVSASGKSRLARMLAETLGAVRLSSDVERKRLHGLSALARSGSPIDAGIYREEVTRATYARLQALAAELLLSGYSVIVDATCLRVWQRNLFRDLAREMDLPFLILDCRAPETLLRKRMEERIRRGNHASEATPAVLARQLEEGEPLSGEETEASILVDTSVEDRSRVIAEIRQRLSEQG